MYLVTAYSKQTTDPVRRQLNKVFFDKLYLDTDEVTDDRLTEPFNDFLYPRTLSRRRVVHTRILKTRANSGAAWDAARGMSTGAALLDRIVRGEGSSKTAMVELPGIEPGSFGAGPGLLRAQSADRFS